MAPPLKEKVLCVVDCCDRYQRQKDFCSKHIYSATKYGFVIGPKLGTPKKTCSVEGCPDRISRRGLCGKHVWRYLRYGTTELPPKPSKSQFRKCLNTQCKSKARVQGLCQTHLNWFNRTGQFEVKPARDVSRQNRYVTVAVKDHPLYGTCNIQEHRLVYSESIGRKLESHEQVHHINGARNDNRIENLELWSTSQPAGQRIEDKVKWAKEILGMYDPESLRTV